jgi:hypothetical protein
MALGPSTMILPVSATGCSAGLVAHELTTNGRTAAMMQMANFIESSLPNPRKI